MPDISDLRPTIVPKSDQLNAEQLLGGDMTITISDVRMGSEEQPVALHYENDEGRPYKPCKTMRKLLIFAWGEDGRNWIGRSMTLYNDQAVRFGGMSVGGIRISHLSDINGDINVSLTATKGKKALHTIQLLHVVTLDQVLAAIAAIKDKASQERAKAMAKKLTKPQEIDRATKAYADKVESLKGGKPKASATPTFADQIAAAQDMQTVQAIGEAMDALPDGPEKESLTQQLLERENQLAPKA